MNGQTQELVSNIKSHGAALVGFADLHEIDSEIRYGLPFGISIAVALNPDIISGIKDGPNNRYYHEYKRANKLLDSISSYTVGLLESQGYKAARISATDNDINWETLTTTFPHKTVATRAGLGWIGKCALLVTKEYGSAIRITSVLTDAELPAAEPIDVSQCGNCTACVEACPGHAPTGQNWTAGIPRESIYDAFACVKTARKFEETRPGLDYNICGICITACPWTQRYLEK